MNVWNTEPMRVRVDQEMTEQISFHKQMIMLINLADISMLRVVW